MLESRLRASASTRPLLDGSGEGSATLTMHQDVPIASTRPLLDGSGELGVRLEPQVLRDASTRPLLDGSGESIQV